MGHARWNSHDQARNVHNELRMVFMTMLYMTWPLVPCDVMTFKHTRAKETEMISMPWQRSTQNYYTARCLKLPCKSLSTRTILYFKLSVPIYTQPYWYVQSSKTPFTDRYCLAVPFLKQIKMKPPKKKLPIKPYPPPKPRRIPKIVQPAIITHIINIRMKGSMKSRWCWNKRMKKFVQKNRDDHGRVSEENKGDMVERLKTKTPWDNSRPRTNFQTDSWFCNHAVPIHSAPRAENGQNFG